MYILRSPLQRITVYVLLSEIICYISNRLTEVSLCRVLPDWVFLTSRNGYTWHFCRGTHCMQALCPLYGKSVCLSVAFVYFLVNTEWINLVLGTETTSPRSTSPPPMQKNKIRVLPKKFLCNLSIDFWLCRFFHSPVRQLRLLPVVNDTQSQRRLGWRVLTFKQNCSKTIRSAAKM